MILVDKNYGLRRAVLMAMLVTAVLGTDSRSSSRSSISSSSSGGSGSPRFSSSSSSSSSTFSSSSFRAPLPLEEGDLLLRREHEERGEEREREENQQVDATTTFFSSSASASSTATAVASKNIATTATILHSNIVGRRDAKGQLMDAHDGSYRQYPAPAANPKLWYYYAMGYGECIENGQVCDGSCGQIQNNTIGLWTSPTLADGSWTLVSSNVLPLDKRPNCVYYRVNTIWNAQTRQFVLWINAQNCASACPPNSTACYLAWTADRPEGPFTYAGPVYTKYTSEGGVGDYALFVDDDVAHTAYVLHKRTGRAEPNSQKHRILLERLDPTYLRSTNKTLGVFGEEFVEAPVMFKRAGVYYAFFGKCCCFCAEGSGVGVYTARNALGPYAFARNIGCPTQPAPGCGCGHGAYPPYTNASKLHCKSMPSVTRAQQNFVIRVPMAEETEEESIEEKSEGHTNSNSSAGGDDDINAAWLWTGDQWQSACVRGLGCVKAWDLQYWYQLVWDDSLDPPLPKPMFWVDNVSLPLKVV